MGMGNPTLDAPQARAQHLMDRVAAWACGRCDVCGVALVGSYARGMARADSDVDLVVLCADPAPYLADSGWLAEFGAVAPPEREDWGAWLDPRGGEW
jgi:predicted nucleotidyltransferase